MQKYKNLQLFHLTLSTIAIILSSISVINAIVTDGTSLLSMLIGLADLFALFFGSLYLIFNYKKDVATFYKAFLASEIVALLLRIIDSFQGDSSPVWTISTFVAFILLIVLVMVKDLGKKNTMTLYAVLWVAEIVITIVSFTKNNIASGISNLLAFGTLGLMITFKYIDKQERKGTLENDA